VSLRAAVDKTRAYLCLECGICTGSCPVSRHNDAYSPRMTVERALLFGEDESLHDREMWSCLTCGTCDLRCPSTVDFTGFMRSVRERAREVGESGVCTHADTLEALLDLQRMPGYRRQSAWLGRGARTRSRSSTYYFGGCLPFLSVVFRDIGFDGKAIGNSSVRLLNHLGIVPAVSEGEVCCGHDEYWTGGGDIVKELAERNVAAIKKTGAKRVVFSCPECYYMFKHVYPELVKGMAFEVVYILDLLSEKIGDIRLKSLKTKVTYHDPCRLAKSDDLIEEPRRVLKSIPDLELVEMRRTGKDALCCGSSNWVSCSRVNKKIQVERLEEAMATGAEALVTACPKCNIHLRCALRDEDCAGEIEIKDAVTLVAGSLGGKKRGR
jgi:heterodisulfide reductase subunit D